MVLPQPTAFTHAEQMWCHILGLPSLQNHAPNKHLFLVRYPARVVQVTDDVGVNWEGKGWVSEEGDQGYT